MSIYI